MFRSLCALPLLVAVLGLAIPAAGQEKKADEVKIRWLGQSMFEIVTSKGTTIVTDPHNIEGYRIKDVLPKLKPDLVLMSHFHTDHTTVEALENAKTVKQLNALKKVGLAIAWNDVDEKFKDVHLATIGTYHDSIGGGKHGLNGIWVLDVDGLRIVHLGDLGHQLSRAQLKKLGAVDVLMVPVGGVYTLNGIDAQRVVEQIKPRRYVLPMHYATPVFDELLVLKYFTDEQEEGTPIRRFKLREWLNLDSKAPLPKKATVAVLNYQWW